MYPGPIVDSHFHIFRRADTPQYVLLSADAVQRDFTLSDYRQAMGGASVVGGIVVQVADVGTGMDELAFVERQPADPRIGRFVAYVPLDRGDAPDIIRHLGRRHPIVAGVRYSHVVDAGGRLLDKHSNVQALGALARHGLVYELSIRPWQYAGLLELARAVPEVTIVLGHLGKPRVRVEDQPDWYDGIEALATLPNVMCKVSVALERPDDPPYDARLVSPLVRHVVSSFGFDRVMFGSNFPVNFISITCIDWLELLDRALDRVSGDDLDKLYRRNAVRAYGLNPV